MNDEDIEWSIVVPFVMIPLTILCLAIGACVYDWWNSMEPLPSKRLDDSHYVTTFKHEGRKYTVLELHGYKSSSMVVLDKEPPITIETKEAK